MPSSILLKEKQAKILVLLKNDQQAWYISSIARSCSTTYVHTCNFLKKCEILGLVKNEKHGKIKEIKLTEKGHRVADSISEIYSQLGQGQQFVQPPQPEPLKSATAPAQDKR